MAAPLSAYRFEVLPGRVVDIRTYGCLMSGPARALAPSREHTELAFLPTDALDEIELPSGYREAISRWRARDR